MKITQKSFLVGLAIFIVGGIVGGLVFTRHYGVGPLAQLSSQQSLAYLPSDAEEPCDQEFTQFMYNSQQYLGGNPAFSYKDYRGAWAAWVRCEKANGWPYEIGW